jgi:Aspartate/tyrosine/aromatic aminotransferase
MVFSGGKFNCYFGVLVVCLSGDEVIIFVLYWVSYSEMVRFVGAILKFVLCDDRIGFKFILVQLVVVIILWICLFILNSFSNFIGVVYMWVEFVVLVDIVV